MGHIVQLLKKKPSKGDGGLYCTSGKNIQRDNVVHIVQAVKNFKGIRWSILYKR